MEHLRPTNLPSAIRLIEVVGRGGSAVVWRARDRRSGRDVAVKVIGLPLDGPLREQTRARFERELRALARLRHDHVLTVSAAGTDRDCCWVLTPLADGTLAGRMDRAPIADPDELCELALAVGSGLAAAHRLDVVHGDVTPANVLDLAGTMVLADFGSSSLDGPRAGPGAATPGWAAPEVLDGAMCAPASDVYGLGATVWTAATGDRSRPGCPPDVSMLPRGLSGLVDVCCDPDPDRRPSATEVRSRAAAELSRRSRYCPDP